VQRYGPSSTPVQAVARAFGLLEALAARDEAGLVELARDASLHPSTAHRLLASLIDCGYAMQNPTTGRYRLGRKMLDLAGGFQGRDARLRRITRAHLETIRARVDETTNLVALDGLSAIYVDQVESQHAVRLLVTPGRRVPAHASSAGKAMLAYQDVGFLEKIYAGEPFAPLTPRTITTAAALRAELGRVRRRGYALEAEEYEEGVTGVSAPILDAAGDAYAALSVSAPSVRLRRHGLAAIGRLLAGHAAQITRELGDGDEAPGQGRPAAAAG
jgi:IclR family acetate operon transcriptional repressor